MNRRCLQCGFIGSMDTWFASSCVPVIIVMVGLVFYFIPGVILWIWAHGKYKCPACGAVGKNSLYFERNKVESKDNFVDLKQGIYGKVPPEFSDDYFYTKNY